MKAHYPKPFNFEAHLQHAEKANEPRQLNSKPRKPGVCIPSKTSADTENKIG